MSSSKPMAVSSTPDFAVYLVGGAVRDALLGRPEGDRDWVVVGATAEDMRARGFVQVGRDFPVFLHPETHEEYALARTERKIAPGHHGFVVHAAPEVTLEEDLRRRDLTINAIARDSDGSLIDPWGGLRDLAARLLRHVSEAFREDPLRVLRLARFAARLPEFRVAAETEDLCREIVATGELATLSAERVWNEVARALVAAQPSRFFEVLRSVGALAVLAPEIDRLWGVPQRADDHPEIDTGIHVMQAIDYAAVRGWPLATCFAVLTHDLGKGETPVDILPAHHGHEARSARLARALAARWRVPREVEELAVLVAAEHGHLGRFAQMRPATIHDVLARCDVLRRPERFVQALDACQADYESRRPPGRPESEGPKFTARRLAERAAEAMRAVDAGPIVERLAAAGHGHRIGDELRRARIEAIRVALAADPGDARSTQTD